MLLHLPQAAQAAKPGEPLVVPPLRLNVNVFTRFARSQDPAERKADEEDVRAMGRFLMDTAIPTAFKHIWCVEDGLGISQ
jgi:hypothetical protein